MAEIEEKAQAKILQIRKSITKKGSIMLHCKVEDWFIYLEGVHTSATNFEKRKETKKKQRERGREKKKIFLQFYKFCY